MAHPYSVPSPIVTISGLDGTLIITPMSITTGALQRFQIASWRGGSQLGLLHARALLRDIQFDTSAMSDLRQLFAAVHETAPPEPFDMVQLLTYELYLGGKFHAFYIPPAEFGHFAVAKAPDLSGLLADPPGPPAGWPIQARIAAMLRRVPAHVVPELKAQVAELLKPKSIALLAIFLSALAVAQAYGVGEIVDAILVGLAWWVARWAGLLAVKDIVTSIIEAGTAQSLPAIDEAAGRFARALLVLGLVFLSKLISRAGDEENVSGFPSNPEKGSLPPPRGSTNDIMQRYKRGNVGVTYPRIEKQIRPESTYDLEKPTPDQDIAVEPLRSKVGAADNEAGALSDINPFGGTQNCVNCAAQTDAMLRGQPYGPAALSGAQPISNLGTNWVSVGGQAEIESILSASGPGSTGIVFGESLTGGVGHVWNAINNGKGGINFLDGQTGGSGLGNFANFQNFQFLQTGP